MTKYFRITYVAIQKNFIYRGKTFSEIILGYIPLLLLLFLYYTILPGNTEITEVFTYIIIGRFIFIVSDPVIHWEIYKMIKNGTIINIILKPINFMLYWFFQNIGEKFIIFITGMIPFIVIIVIFNNYITVIPSSNIVPFIISLILSFTFYFLLYFMVSLLSFFFFNISSFFFTLYLIVEFLSGAIIPISFFDEEVKIFFNLLPFRYIVDFPMTIYLNNITTLDLQLGLLIIIVWIIIFLILIKIIWAKALRSYEGIGG